MAKIKRKIVNSLVIESIQDIKIRVCEGIDPMQRKVRDVWNGTQSSVPETNKWDQAANKWITVPRIYTEIDNDIYDLQVEFLGIYWLRSGGILNVFVRDSNGGYHTHMEVSDFTKWIHEAVLDHGIGWGKFYFDWNGQFVYLKFVGV